MGTYIVPYSLYVPGLLGVLSLAGSENLVEVIVCEVFRTKRVRFNQTMRDKHDAGV